MSSTILWREKYERLVRKTYYGPFLGIIGLKLHNLSSDEDFWNSMSPPPSNTPQEKAPEGVTGGHFESLKSSPKSA